MNFMDFKFSLIDDIVPTKTLYVCGCDLKCSYCFNKDLWSHFKGQELTEEFLLKECKIDLFDSITFSGASALSKTNSIDLYQWLEFIIDVIHKEINIYTHFKDLKNASSSIIALTDRFNITLNSLSNVKDLDDYFLFMDVDKVQQWIFVEDNLFKANRGNELAAWYGLKDMYNINKGLTLKEYKEV